MRRQMKRAMLAATLICAVICAPFLTAQGAQDRVSLSGYVYDHNGKALGGARIFLFPLEAAIGGPLPAAISNQDGSYHLTAPAFGKTRICASLERLGYPDTFNQVFSSPADQFPELILSAGSQFGNVDIHLGPPDGIFEGTVVDRETGAIVQLARITLRWAEDPSVLRSENVPRSGHFLYALPKRQISIEIAAPGYRPWTYRNPSTNAQFIELESDDHRSLTIELERTGANPSEKP
jgi:hypothetical protein